MEQSIPNIELFAPKQKGLGWERKRAGQSIDDWKFDTRNDLCAAAEAGIDRGVRSVERQPVNRAAEKQAEEWAYCREVVRGMSASVGASVSGRLLNGEADSERHQIVGR